MASTTLPPPKSFRGTSPRELLSAEAGDDGPPVTVFGQTTRGPITFRAGPELVIEEPEAGYVRVDEGNTDPITLNVAGYKRIAFQCVIQATSVPEGTRIVFKRLRFIGGAWEYLNAADSGPYLPLHEVKTDGGGKLIPVLSGWFTIDPENDIDNITLEWGVEGGDGTGEVIIGNIYAELSADNRPPTQETPTPETPTSLLLADWRLYIGNIGGDSSGNGHTLTLGADVPNNQDPTYVADPTRGLLFGNGASLLLKYAVNSTLPWNTGGNDLRALSVVFFFRFASLPTGTPWIYRLTSTDGSQLNMRLNDNGSITATRNSIAGPGGATTSVLSPNTDYFIAFTNEAASGGAITMYVNAVVDGTGTMPAPATAFTSQPNLLWGTDNAGFTSAAALPAIIGRTQVHDGALTQAQVTELYAVYKADGYEDLP